MATPVKMQRLSKFTETSEVVEWFKSPGETIREGAPLLVVSSDKATVEIEAPASGVLLEVTVSAGTEVQAGEVLAWIGQPGEMPEREEPPTLPVDRAENSDAQAETPPRLAAAGKVKAVPAARRLAVEHQIRLDGLKGTGPEQIITKADVEKAILETEGPLVKEKRRISPVARRLAKEARLKIEQIEGTGPGGQITKADIECLNSEDPLKKQVDAYPDDTPTKLESTATPLGDLRRVMVQRMTASHQTIVQATTVADVDMTEIVQLRERIPASFTAFVVKAAAAAVSDYPLVNAVLAKSMSFSTTAPWPWRFSRMTFSRFSLSPKPLAIPKATASTGTRDRRV